MVNPWLAYMCLARIKGFDEGNNASMTLQALSALVTEAMRDAHGKSVAVRVGLHPHLCQIPQIVPTWSSPKGAPPCVTRGMAQSKCIVFPASVLRRGAANPRTAQMRYAGASCAESAFAGKPGGAVGLSLSVRCRA